MGLLRRKLLILDCQTTGTSAARDHLLELGWAWVEPGEENPEAESALFRITAPLPRMVTEITGITREEAEKGMEPAEAFRKFTSSLSLPPASSSGHRILSLAHYAQFERGFLEKLFQENSAANPLDLLCTYRIAQRLFPEAPSRNIRGLAGYLGCELPELRRAADHVRATALIWSRIEKELESRGIHTREELDAWMAEKPRKGEKKEKPKTAFHLSREKRLALPKGPGIYRMLSKTGEVLYVGKATSLHSRVNSYFRGGVSRDPRKLELLARVYDIEVEECASPLEAALLENEEIKRRAPKYNRALRPSTRALAFFDRAFVELSAVQDEAHPLGPFREGSAALELHGFLRGLEQGLLVDVFFDLVTEEALKEGFALFLSKEDLPVSEVPALRRLLAIGMRELRQYLKLKKLAEELEEQLAVTEADTETETEAEQPSEDSADADETEAIITPEEVAEKFTGLAARAAEELRRAKRLGRLLNAEITYETKPEEWHSLSVAGGNILLEKLSASPQVLTTPPSRPWAGLKIDDYDRMSVLLAELHRFPHRVAPLNPLAKENGAP